MALAFRSAAAAQDSANVTSLVVGPPSGLADNDILVLFLGLGREPGTVTLPSGFSEVSNYNGFGDTGEFSISWKRASSESGNYTASWTDSSRAAAVLVAVSGALTSGTPFNIGTMATGSSSEPDPPSVDPGSSDDRLAIAAYNFEGKAITFTPPSGYTAPANGEAANDGAGVTNTHGAVGVAYRTYTGQTENPGTATANGTAAWAANTLVFSPAAGGGFQAAWAANSNVIVGAGQC